MNRNTMTTLGELRTGDRFTYPNRFDVWEVKEVLKYASLVNRAEKNHQFKHHDKKAHKVKVRFLRHTQIQPGEECFIEDLKPGDVFHKLDDIITEYVVLGQMTTFSEFFGVRVLQDGEPVGDPEMAGRLATVVLVRKKEEVAS